MNVPDVKAKRAQWNDIISKFNENSIVYLDESGVNTNLTRRYARSMGGTRATDHVPLNTPTNTTILSSVRLNGETAYTTYQGGTTKDKFITYLNDTLLPTLKEGDVIIMDNMRSHRVKEVAELISKSNKHLSLLYLPPYSPDFNPIEMMWSKIKAILRKLRVRKLFDLDNAIDIAFSLVSPLDCLGWFSSVAERY